MVHSAVATHMVASFEGLELKAYTDQRGIWTLGYGHTSGVKEGDTCTPVQALGWLSGDLSVADRCLTWALNDVLATLNQNEWDALVSLTFNIGCASIYGSTVRREIRAGNFPLAAGAFLLWNKVHGQVDPGLVKRRAAERALFLTPVAA